MHRKHEEEHYIFVATITQNFLCYELRRFIRTMFLVRSTTNQFALNLDLFQMSNGLSGF